LEKGIKNEISFTIYLLSDDFGGSLNSDGQKLPETDLLRAMLGLKKKTQLVYHYLEPQSRSEKMS